MKSAYELALERSGGKLNQVPAGIREKLAETDRVWQAKIAEAKLAAERKLKTESDPEKAEAVRTELVQEVAALKERMEREKERIRKG